MHDLSDLSALRSSQASTSAAAHPELVSGDFAIPPRTHDVSGAIRRSVIHDQRRAMGGTLALAAIAFLLSGLALRSGATAGSDIDPQQLGRVCLQWHMAASAVVSRQVQSTRDVDLVMVTNSIDRMRRARRNCELGAVVQACEDYHAVATSMPGHAMTKILFPCERLAVTATR